MLRKKYKNQAQSLKKIYIYITTFLIKIKITEIHSTVPYLTISKSGRRKIKYKRKLIKRKLLKIYILGS